MRGTFQNAGMPISIAILFPLTIVGLTSRVPHAMCAGLTANGVPAATGKYIHRDASVVAQGRAS